jgi:hypothetical protein
MSAIDWKLAIIDLDGVVAVSDARFAKAEEAKTHALARNADQRQATQIYWQTAFDPALVALDVPVAGAQGHLSRMSFVGYKLIYLTSRPEVMGDATTDWLVRHHLWTLAEGLWLKPEAAQFTKTYIWKAGEAQRLTLKHGMEWALFVDDEEKNREELLRHVSPNWLTAASLEQALTLL